MNAVIGVETLSVVILTYNNKFGPQSIIERLPPGVEIVVVDDGSDEDPVLPDGVKYESLRPKMGNRAASCRNRGVEMTQREKILFLDDDVIPHPGLCFAHILALKMYEVSIGVLCQDGFKPHTDERLTFYTHESRLWRYTWTGNLGIRRETFQELGGFDTLYNGGHGFEDIDLGRSITKQKRRTFLNTLALATHPSQQLAMSGENPLVIDNMKKFEEKWNELF